MKFLENKIPPPVLVLLVGGLMGGAARMVPGVTLPATLRYALAGVCATSGLLVMFTAVRAFQRAQTTINPLDPTQASTIVSGGVFGLSRNPMYVGMTLLLLAWAVFLSSPWTLVGPLFFVLYITRWQILPEERALTAKFGAAYEDYRKTVRRWI